MIDLFYRLFNQEELVKRISLLDYPTISSMSSDVITIVTGVFDEPLVKALIMKGANNKEQRDIFNSIRTAYLGEKNCVDPFAPFPEVCPPYMDKLKTDLECGWIITPDGAIPSPPKNTVSTGFPYVNPENDVYKGVTIDKMTTELLSRFFIDNNEEVAAEFLEEAKGRDDIGIADLITEYKVKFSPMFNKGFLWSILHAAQLYSSTDRNFTTALRKRGW